MDTSASFWVYAPNKVYGLNFVCLSVAVPVTKAKWMLLGQFPSKNTICEETMAPPELDGLSRTDYNESNLRIHPKLMALAELVITNLMPFNE